ISLPDDSGQAKGRLLKEVLLQPGYHANIREKTETLWITCGNAPSLRIKVDGEVIAAKGSLGSGKKVLRDYRFSIK
ncbi:MAG: RodZ domain-containing protein, partial [Mariprofundus sp.]